jgi:hypothetical protein
VLKEPVDQLVPFSRSSCGDVWTNYISIDAQEVGLSDGVKIAFNSCVKMIFPGKLWKLFE